MSNRILITGASSGLGRALAESAAERGWDSLLLARSQDRLAQAVDELRRQFPATHPRYLAMDLTDDNAMLQLGSFLDETGPLDIAVHNAGVGAFGRFHEIDPARLETVTRLGVMASTRIARLVIPRFLHANGGCFVLIGSTSGRKPVPWMSAYAASKAFIHRFGMALVEEYRATPVRILIVIPGGMATRFHKTAGFPPRFMPPKHSPQRVAQRILDAIAQGQRGTLHLGSRIEQIGGILQHLLPESWWARRMAGRYAPYLDKASVPEDDT